MASITQRIHDGLSCNSLGLTNLHVNL